MTRVIPIPFQWRLLPLYFLPLGYIAYLGVRGLPLHDPCPVVNLGLRFLMMDLVPILWVFSFFWRKFPGGKVFLRNLVEMGKGSPVPLAAPFLAVILFFYESAEAVRDPSLAGPTALGAVLWMQASAAFMTGLVLFHGTRKGTTGGFSRKRWILSALLAGGGLGFFLATHCDISRLLITVGLAGLGIQKAMRN